MWPEGVSEPGSTEGLYMVIEKTFKGYGHFLGIRGIYQGHIPRTYKG